MTLQKRINIYTSVICTTKSRELLDWKTEMAGLLQKAGKVQVAGTQDSNIVYKNTSHFLQVGSACAVSIAQP